MDRAQKEVAAEEKKQQEADGRDRNDNLPVEPPAPFRCPQRPPTTVTFATPERDSAEGALLTHAMAMRYFLWEKSIAGDGHCLYRSVACSTPDGERSHGILRGLAAMTVNRNARCDEFFRDYIKAPWVKRQLQGAWGDGISLRALSLAMRKPFVVFRRANPEQPPSIFLDFDFQAGESFVPIYLILDERVVGAEHYSALATKEGLPAAVNRRSRDFFPPYHCAPPSTVKIPPKPRCCEEDYNRENFRKGRHPAHRIAWTAESHADRVQILKAIMGEDFEEEIPEELRQAEDYETQEKLDAMKVAVWSKHNVRSVDDFRAYLDGELTMEDMSGTHKAAVAKLSKAGNVDVIKKVFKRQMEAIQLLKAGTSIDDAKRHTEQPWNFLYEAMNILFPDSLTPSDTLEGSIWWSNYRLPQNVFGGLLWEIAPPTALPAGLLKQGRRSTHELDRLYGIDQKNFCRWNHDFEAVRGHFEAHTAAIVSAEAGSCTYRDIKEDFALDDKLAKNIMRLSPGAAIAWKEEHQRLFSVTGPIAHAQSLPPPVMKRRDPLAWMKTASWTFCPDCGLRSTTRQLHWDWMRNGQNAVSQKCCHGCDPHPDTLEQDYEEQDDNRPWPKKLQAYITPQELYWKKLKQRVCMASPEEDRDVPWEDFWAILPKKDLEKLSLLDLRVDYTNFRGGKAPITSKKKKSVVKGVWKPHDIEQHLPSEACRRAFEFLRDNNEAYRGHLANHRQLLANNRTSGSQQWRWILTADLLLNHQGLEVAARPWLYPTEAFGDTDLSDRLKARARIPDTAKPSLKASWQRKIFSRCVDYSKDYHLTAFLHDVALARQLSAVTAAAEDLKIAPDIAASDMQNFEAFWKTATQKLEDACRINGDLPNLFFTAAPAEWTFPLHHGLLAAAEANKDLSSCQAWLTLHLYNAVSAVLEKTILREGTHLAEIGLEEVIDYAYRFEFQGRGTLHVHVIAWVKYASRYPDPTSLSGRSGENHKSPFTTFLEETFKCRADVQCGNSEHCLLCYVAGYVSKAEDALHFKPREKQVQGNGRERSRWQIIFRLLCKRQLLEQEMQMMFACQGFIKTSFTTDTLFAPVPGSETINNHRHAYQAYDQYLKKTQTKPYMKEFLEATTPMTRKAASDLLQKSMSEVGQVLISTEEGGRDIECKTNVILTLESGLEIRYMSFMEWYRRYQVTSIIKEAKATEADEGEAPIDDQPQKPSFLYTVARRNLSGPGRGKKCAIGLALAFELMDIFMGGWCACFLPGCSEEELKPTTTDPENMQHLRRPLEHFQGDPQRLLQAVMPDHRLRGLSEDRIFTFRARILAVDLLLQRIKDGREKSEDWAIKNLYAAGPEKIWSAEQKEVLDAIEAGTTIGDARQLEEANRVLQVSGKPGTGKTEVLIEGAIKAAQRGCKVLIGGPIGLLVSNHRQRLPPDLDITVETIHAAFKIGRDRDKQYIPPGRLRHYDLIIFDEVSQVDGDAWRLLQTAFSELWPTPYVVFVGDFQQLQPVFGAHRLNDDLNRQYNLGRLHRVELQQHAAARSNDPDMLRFLHHARVHQPTRHVLSRFFEGRRLPKDLNACAHKAIQVEKEQNTEFTFLTITNRGAAKINMARLALQFPNAARQLREGHGCRGDDAYGQGKLFFEIGMRVRLTQNIDKKRGFVNGATGTIVAIYAGNVIVVRTLANVLILVHQVFKDSCSFMPVTYAYATTIRRAQGATLDLIGLYFDRKMADRGYAYVGASRARLRKNVYLVGKIRRSDWLPVGKDELGNEQVYPSAESATTDSEDEARQSSEPSFSEEETESDAEPSSMEEDSVSDDEECRYDDPGPDPSGEFDDDEYHAFGWAFKNLQAVAGISAETRFEDEPTTALWSDEPVGFLVEAPGKEETQGTADFSDCAEDIRALFSSSLEPSCATKENVKKATPTETACKQDM